MKKLLTVVCLSGLLSVPSVVFAEASWYGSLRAGIISNDTAGVSDGFKGFPTSRWGIKGSSEVSEGLTAVYRFEQKIDAAEAAQTVGRLSYVGLSGGFGTLTIGQVWSASFNSVGAFFDNSTFLGNSETSYRVGHAVSYAVSVENISIQADAIMNKNDGNTADKNVDQVELGVSMGLGESGKIALAHKSHDTTDTMKTTSNWIAGQYTIGGMTGFVGFGQKKTTNDTAIDDEAPGDNIANTQTIVDRSRTDKTTFMGVRGSVGDTGVSYVFQARSKKASGTQENKVGESDNNDNTMTNIAANKHTPWLLGLSRSLGGGASVHFEYDSPDQDGSKSTSYLALKVDF